MDWILHTPPQFIALLALLGTPRSGSRKGPQPAPAGPRPPSDAGRGAAGRRLALGRGAAGVPALPASATRLLHTFTKMCGSLARKTCRRRGRGCRARRGMQDGGPAPGPAPRTPNPAPAPRTPTPDPEPGPRTRTPDPDPGPGPRTRTPDQVVSHTGLAHRRCARNHWAYSLCRACGAREDSPHALEGSAVLTWRAQSALGNRRAWRHCQYSSHAGTPN